MSYLGICHFVGAREHWDSVFLIALQMTNERGRFLGRVQCPSFWNLPSEATQLVEGGGLWSGAAEKSCIWGIPSTTPSPHMNSTKQHTAPRNEVWPPPPPPPSHRRKPSHSASHPSLGLFREPCLLQCGWCVVHSKGQMETKLAKNNLPLLRLQTLSLSYLGNYKIIID